MRNHEGYYDPTAGEAIKRIVKQKYKKRRSAPLHLYYLISEVPGFKHAATEIQERQYDKRTACYQD